jgi:CDP-diacylglycerol--glycerol-3-phosphate 3-phosphatidyltransferase/cardiolipin synthase
LRAGVRIYLWNGPMLHAKTLVVDGMIALIGSSNLNPWSMMGCYELDLQLEDSGVATALERQFLRDIQRARELSLAEWRHRPAAERWKERLGAGLLWLPYKLYSG